MVRRSLFLPGCIYMHDLALIDGRLHGNAVGHNAVISIDFEEGFKRVWWPKCIENHKGPVFEQNHIQLNSIAAGKSLSDSYFSASSTSLAKLRPGDAKYPVDGRGVIFSGKTREPVCRRTDTTAFGQAGQRTAFCRQLRLRAIVTGGKRQSRPCNSIGRMDTRTLHPRRYCLCWDVASDPQI